MSRAVLAKVASRPRFLLVPVHGGRNYDWKPQEARICGLVRHARYDRLRRIKTGAAIAVNTRLDESRTGSLDSLFALHAEADMAGALLNDVLAAVTVLAFAVLIAAPLTTLGVMFWHWQKELSRSVRLRQARTTQVR